MSDDIADVVVTVHVLHVGPWLLSFFFLYFETLSCIFCCFEGVSEGPVALRPLSPPHPAVGQDAVGFFVAHESCGGDDDSD